jgi:hypothetical protein
LRTGSPMRKAALLSRLVALLSGCDADARDDGRGPA